MQKEMVADLSDRADKVRSKMVDSSVDNMLLITNDRCCHTGHEVVL